MDYSFIYLLHIFFGAPLLIYGGYAGKQLSEKCKDEQYMNVFMMLIFVGIVLILYHGNKFLRIKGMLQ